MAEKLASALLKIRKGDGWLIPEPYRSSGTAEEICRCVERDHIVLHAHGGSCAPQNLDPMLKADHREKSRSDTTKAAKSKRISAEHEAFRQRMLAKLQTDVDAITPSGGNPKKAKIKSRGFSKTHRRKLDGSVVRREAE
jgi:hypothetical protein